MKRVRMVDIAEALGVAKATVSMALRHHPRISEATRRRVEEKALEMGYVPDPALSRLAERRWAGQTGQRYSNMVYIAWGHDDYANRRKAVYPCLKEAAAVLGYEIDQMVVEDYPDIPTAVRILKARGVDGIVLHCSSDPGAWKGFPFDRFSGVELFSGRAPHSGYSIVREDRVSTFLDIAEKVLQKMPRSVGIMLLEQTTPSDVDIRDEAICLLVSKRWRSAGIRSVHLKKFKPGKKSGPDFNYQAIEWIKKTKPEVLVLPNAGLSWLVRETGLGIGKEIELVAIASGEDPVEGIARYDRRLDAIATRAVHHVDALIRSDIRGPSEYPENIVVPNVWVPGTSFG